MTPGLDWDAFGNLPGDPRDNFERLCRAATWHGHARYGRFAARAQQPGVEFHLVIQRPGCSLGDPGRWYGWQTKWWDLPAGRPIGATRRKDVEDSIKKTTEHVAGITDWVLWTRRPLTAGDQEWFYGLATDMEMHLWTADADLDTLLVGDAGLLRETYFGDLVLTPERLADQHTRLVSEAGDRWVPDVHQVSSVERALRRALGEPDAWSQLQVTGHEIARFAAAVASNTAGLDEAMISEIEAIVGTGEAVADGLTETHDQLRAGRATTLVELGHRTVPPVPPANPAILRRLRAQQHPAAPPLTNLISHIREAATLAEHVENHLTTGLVVVTGDAGYGKTQLAATLSAPTADRQAGVLLYGRRLTARGTLDDLAGQMTVAGVPLTSFEALLAAVDAAAERAGSRLPVVIDGLNEAEVATTWAPLLRSLIVTLNKYPSVLVVCTVRDAFLESAVPDEVREVLSLDGFDEDLDEAIARYFTHYKIETGDAELPRGLLNHPLTLKIYCKVVNPDRNHVVTGERLPASLSGMFDEYLLTAAHRVHELNASIDPRDVATALASLGADLWDTRAREVSEARAQELFGDTGRRWHESLLAALEHEGLIIRQPGVAGGTSVSLVYDLLAGHVIATSLLQTHGAAVPRLLGDDDTTAYFTGAWETRHPLATDIFDALAGAMPRRGAGHLWQVVAESLRLPALLRAAGLEADHLDPATVEELANNIDTLHGRDGDVFDRLYRNRAMVQHPLNARFLDRVLHDRTVADRDLRWTEWLRAHAGRQRADAAALAARWRAQPERSDADQLRARWLAWTLTTTDRGLRDAATAALYWFGTHNVDELFTLALEALTINDNYVGERVAAAAYGVATTYQHEDSTFAASLASYLARLGTAVTGDDATAPTFHALTRHYVAGTFALARRFYPDALPGSVTDPFTFAAGPTITPLRDGDPDRDEVGRTMRTDFRNYTLGRQFPGRRNYDFDHPGHRDAVDRVLGVVHALGWRADRFTEVERAIDGPPRRDRDPGRVDRYGKKYGWIGFHTVSGELADSGNAPGRPEVDIDPTFPQPLQPAPLDLPNWTPRTPADDVEWLRDGVVTVPQDFLTPQRIGEHEAAWVLVHAEIQTEDAATGRRTFGLFNTILVHLADVDALTEALETASHPGRDVIDIPVEYDVFAGEIPWHDRFAAPGPGYSTDDLYRANLRIDGAELAFEVLAHHFAWESHHSDENQVAAYIPSRLLSAALDLRGTPPGFDQVDPSGSLATRSFAAPTGFTGEVLYVREDLLRRYAGDRAIVMFGWGQRDSQLIWPEQLPDAVQELYESHENIWRSVKRL